MVLNKKWNLRCRNSFLLKQHFFPVLSPLLNITLSQPSLLLGSIWRCIKSFCSYLVVLCLGNGFFFLAKLQVFGFSQSSGKNSQQKLLNCFVFFIILHELINGKLLFVFADSVINERNFKMYIKYCMYLYVWNYFYKKF